MVVNGRSTEVEPGDRESLADFLRDKLALTGTHLACEQGVCGACTVLLEGAPVRACLVLARQAEGARVETVEGMADDSGLHPLQEIFSRCHAMQCGFCTPGFLILIAGALAERPDLSNEEIRELVSSNLCRCTGYEPICRAARTFRDSEPDSTRFQDRVDEALRARLVESRAHGA